MIVSFDRNFLFVKTTKTAGTSIEVALSRILNSEKDIITTIPPEDELIRLKEGGLSPQNWANTSNNLIEKIKKWRKLIKFCRNNYNDLLISASNEVSIKRLLTLKTIIYSNKYDRHMKLDDIIDRIGLDCFKQLFSFAVIRHPFTKVISLWMYRTRGKDLSTITLSQIRTEIKNMIDTNYNIEQKDFCFSEKYQVQVTKIYKFEELDSAMRDACLQIGLDRDLVLPLPNANTKSGKQSRLPFCKQEILNEELKELIYSKYRWDFDNFYKTECWK
jgi:hypothetical protein